MTRHRTGNYWFADRLLDSEPGYSAAFPWRVFLQMPGFVDSLSTGFPSQQAAEAFILTEIAGAGVKHDPETP